MIIRHPRDVLANNNIDRLKVENALPWSQVSSSSLTASWATTTTTTRQRQQHDTTTTRHKPLLIADTDTHGPPPKRHTTQHDTTRHERRSQSPRPVPRDRAHCIYTYIHTYTGPRSSNESACEVLAGWPRGFVAKKRRGM